MYVYVYHSALRSSCCILVLPSAWSFNNVTCLLKWFTFFGMGMGIRFKILVNSILQVVQSRRDLKICSPLPRKYTHLPYSELSVSIKVSSDFVYCNNQCHKDSARGRCVILNFYTRMCGSLHWPQYFFFFNFECWVYLFPNVPHSAHICRVLLQWNVYTCKLLQLL